MSLVTNLKAKYGNRRTTSVLYICVYIYIYRERERERERERNLIDGIIMYMSELCSNK
jgi:hypothetical protein